MPKQVLYKIIKVSTTKIKRHKRNLGNILYEEAQKEEQIVAIGDNLVLRKLRELKKDKLTPDEIFDQLKNIESQLEKIKQLPYSTKLIKTRQKLEAQLLSLQYVTDIVNVYVENKKHYKEIALNGFTLNGTAYKRFCCGAGQMRRNTVTFINEVYYEKMTDALMCGLHNKIETITLAKLSAYFALSFSSVLWVRKPRFCVIPDLETVLKKQPVDVIIKQKDGTKKVETKEMDLTLNSCDGEGLISPQCAEWFSGDMGLDYTCCQFVVRTAFVKGCLLTFDFKSYLKEVCQKDKIKSIYGEEFYIDDLDILLTESMFKMHKYYTSTEQYQNFHDANHLHWGVARYNKKQDDHYTQLNYQYIQNNNLNDESIEKLLTPTKEWFTKICSGDKLYSILYAIGCRGEEETFEEIQNSCSSIHAKAIVQNAEMLNDGYVQSKIYQSIKESFRQAKIGKLWCRGGYQFMLSDPVPLLRNAVGLDPTGLIPSNHIYSAYWNRDQPKQLDLCRSPMVDRHEHNVVSLAASPDMDYWYQHLYSGIIYSIYDTSTIRHSDSDFDGDIVFSTDNKTLISGAYRDNLPITYEKEKAPKKAVTYENIIACDLDGFDTLVGQITNHSTSLNAMLPLFPKESKPDEHEEMLLRLKLLREIIGAEIDKIKLGVAPEFPQDWIKRQHIDKEQDSEEVIAEKIRANSMVICKKPYFMIHLYDKLKQSYKNHMRQFQLDCKNNYNVTLYELIQKPEKTPEEQKFIRKAGYFSPVLDTPCVMNKICHKVEQLETGILKKQKEQESMLPSFSKHMYTIQKKKLLKLEEFYKEYKARRKFTFVKKLLTDMNSQDEFFEFLHSMTSALVQEYQNKCYTHISSNTTELFEYMIALSESETIKNFDFTFIWDILGNDILKIIPQKNSIIYKESRTGMSYLGKKYEVMEVELT